MTLFDNQEDENDDDDDTLPPPPTFTLYIHTHIHSIIHSSFQENIHKGNKQQITVLLRVRACV